MADFCASIGMQHVRICGYETAQQPKKQPKQEIVNEKKTCVLNIHMLHMY